MKAITPVIALVMLLLITVGIVGASYTWFGGLMSSQTKKSITIPPGGAYCADGDIKVYVLNNGDTTLTSSDITVAQVDGVDVKGTPFFGDMRSGLVGYWKFDEASGATAKDSSGVTPPNDGTLNGNPQRVVGKSRNALKFDGADDYVEMANSAGLNPTSAITVSAWIMAGDMLPGSTGDIVGKGWDSQYELIYEKANSRVLFYYKNDIGWNNVPSTIASVTSGQWVHVAGTYDSAGGSNNLKIYVNGVRSNQKTMVGSIATTASKAYIGSVSGSARYFNGAIDEVKIYNKAAGDVNIQPGLSGVVINYPGVTGRHTIRIGTSSGVAEASPDCA